MSENTWTEAAREILDCCLRERAVPDDLILNLTETAAGTGQAARDAGEALFREVAEPLADRFEPRLCDAYAAVFAKVIARVVPQWSPGELTERYERLRRRRVIALPASEAAARIYVLSRVTLGADVAITSVVLDAAKKRFPRAEIWFVGPAKNWELFAGDPRLRHVSAPYARAGTLSERLSAGLALQNLDGIIIDPDSRLTQLGLLPVCAEERYLFFESRSYGGDGNEPLPELTRRWVAEVLGIGGANPYIAPRETGGGGGITVSLGVGDNPRKRVSDPFEERLLGALAERGLPLLVDKGAGGEEQRRVERAVAGLADHANLRTWEGPFAPFAAEIARSRLYAGYDSAGQHVAAACGTPLVCIFSGFACERAFWRWRPAARGPAEVVRVDGADPEGAWAGAKAALERLLASRR
ncbi:MAG: hypothetical protein KIT09_12630 [Bryobacteraceae bacterium]|nr:hypothetical protein [Bryobacteraceae bacterium]